MRFGIMTMQRQALIPPDLTVEAAMVHLASFDHAELARHLFDSGFDPIELAGDMPLLLPQTLDPSTVERLARLKESRGVTYTVHLPLWSVEPSTPLAPIRDGSVRAAVEVLTATLPLAPEVFVLHATGALATEFYRMEMPALARAYMMRQFQANARLSIEAILAQAGIPSRQLAIETVEFPFDLTLELAEELDLSICLDTGHVLAGFAGPIGLFEALAHCLPRLAEVHFHDATWQGPQQIIGYGKDHQPLGTADLDVGRFLDALQAADFKGPLIFELTLAQALQSKEVIRTTRPGALLRTD
jgi:sugar phosphate isomerase/epimerase